MERAVGKKAAKRSTEQHSDDEQYAIPRSQKGDWVKSTKKKKEKRDTEETSEDSGSLDLDDSSETPGTPAPCPLSSTVNSEAENEPEVPDPVEITPIKMDTTIANQFRPMPALIRIAPQPDEEQGTGNVIGELVIPITIVAQNQLIPPSTSAQASEMQQEHIALLLEKTQPVS